MARLIDVFRWRCPCSSFRSRRHRVPLLLHQMSSPVAVIVISSFVRSHHLFIVASSANRNRCCHRWHCCCCPVLVIIAVAITALAIDRLKVDKGVELSLSSAPPLHPRQQIGGQRHAAVVPRLSPLMQWWLAATTACCSGGWGRNGFSQLNNHNWHHASQPHSGPCEVLAFTDATGAKFKPILLTLPHHPLHALCGSIEKKILFPCSGNVIV
jgi:hypothetical protein